MDADSRASGYFVGDSLTIADLRVFSYLESIADGDLDYIAKDTVSAYPNLTAYVARIKALPKIAEYYASRPGQHKYRLTYFQGPGYGDPIRIALKIAGISFEDVRLSDEEWVAYKPNAPNKALPVLEIDNVKIAQSNAILIYAGQQGALYPTDPLLALKVLEVLVSIDETLAPCTPLWYETDPVKLAAVATELTDGVLKTWFSRFESTLSKSASGFIVGASLTVADLKASSYEHRTDSNTSPYSQLLFGAGLAGRLRSQVFPPHSCRSSPTSRRTWRRSRPSRSWLSTGLLTSAPSPDHETPMSLFNEASQRVILQHSQKDPSHRTKEEQHSRTFLFRLARTHGRQCLGMACTAATATPHSLSASSSPTSMSVAALVSSRQ